MDPSTLGDRTVDLVAEWREFLVNADDGYLRHIPEPGVNSPIQYGAHVRDIIRVYRDRMVLGVEQDNPTVPMHHPRQEVWEEYNRMDPEVLATDMETQAAKMKDVVDGMRPDAWNRVVINDRGRYGVYSFTIAGLARNIVHETYHHLLDAKGTLFSGASSDAGSG
jgi:hypothetical protein